MSILGWFARNKRSSNNSKRLNIPGNLWVKCPSCKEVLFIKKLERNMKVCALCSYHFRISPYERLRFTFDEGSFDEMFSDVLPKDFLSFEDTEPYKIRIEKANHRSNSTEAIVTGVGELFGKKVGLGIMDFSFMGGSMGFAVGERLTRLIEHCTYNTYPLITFSSSGGARMQEGIFSLMQMAKTSAALERFSEASLPYISVLCDPTTGGTSASFAMLGDIHIAEPGALISFAGPRVIEQVIRQKLPKGFQRSEFLLEKGMVDMIVERARMRTVLRDILTMIERR